MAQIKRDQLVYIGRGPLDLKSLVKTYSELTNVSTWTKQVVDDDGSEKEMFVAYNGMIVAVWFNKEDTSKNGLYYLFDPNVTTVTKKPDVTNGQNWHRLDNNYDLNDLVSSLELLEKTVADKADKADLSAYYTRESADNKFVTLDVVDESLNSKADKEYTYTKEEVDSIQASLVSTVSSLSAIVGTEAVDETPATGLFAKFATVNEEIADLVTKTNANYTKLDGITGTVLQAIEDAVNKNVPTLEVATSEQLGGIKSGEGDNIISVSNDGIASVSQISVNTLTQKEGDTLVLCGGDSDLVSI